MRKIISRVIEFVFQAKTPYTWNLGRSGGMVYAHDSKSCLERDEGSSPSSGTRQETRSVSDWRFGGPAPRTPRVSLPRPPPPRPRREGGGVVVGGWRPPPPRPPRVFSAPPRPPARWRVRFEPKIFWR